MPSLEALKLRMNESWSRRHRLNGRLSDNVLQQGRAYADGFLDELRLSRQSWQPVKLSGSASAIVLAGREGDLKFDCLRELNRLPLQEIIVVLEDAAGRDYDALRALPGITVVHVGTALQRDSGRSIGARLLRTDTMLFCDAHAPIPAERLAYLLAAVDSGADVAISETTDALGVFRKWDELSRVKAFVNWSLGRPDLLANSNSELPNAWSRRAVNLVGEAALSLPPVAQQTALYHQLNIVVCRNVHPVGNLRESGGLGVNSLAAFGHLAALKAAMDHRGGRLSHPDRVRRRGAAGGAAH
ncbi:hypothetical protein GCM10010911_04200 [Paenibacillus nasutitermitis]|uniref:Glycosyltransferase 2-like domain-containing protein n=1 Tax=Paenibacillus nasutitermitis TaxID=1652958 RepID=A0A916YLD9_9BACL|nr:hypothetical protein GCM10010911_04200 [Paenibacillus nasutitermitis]